MKFCENCGKQLLDDAVVCTGCGCSAMPISAVQLPKDLGPKEPFHSKQSVTSIVLAGIGILLPVLGILFGIVLNLLLGLLGPSVSALLDIVIIAFPVIGLVFAIKARKTRKSDTLAFISIFVAIGGIVVSTIVTILHMIIAVIALIPLVFICIYIIVIIVYILIIVVFAFIALLAV